MSRCPVQRAISRLKRYAGMPVPAVVRWNDDKPDFRAINIEAYLRMYRFQLCAVCGTKLTLSCYWIGGPTCVQWHYFADGPMHRECAELSISACPFLNATRPSYRGDDLPTMPIQDATTRPATMYLFRGVTSAIELRKLGAESLALYAGKQLATIREF